MQLHLPVLPQHLKKVLETMFCSSPRTTLLLQQVVKNPLLSFLTMHNSLLPIRVISFPMTLISMTMVCCRWCSCLRFLSSSPGEALYRFLLSQASTPPTVILRCKGSHNETHTRLVSSPHNGHTKMKTEQYTERITDFEFCIDVGQHIVGGPTHWSCADSTPAYRGRMYQEVGINEERQKAKKSEIRAAKGWDSERAHRGFPPWIGSDYVWREDQP